LWDREWGSGRAPEGAGAALGDAGSEGGGDVDDGALGPHREPTGHRHPCQALSPFIHVCVCLQYIAFDFITLSS